jgi:hypothetical protein
MLTRPTLSSKIEWRHPLQRPSYYIDIPITETHYMYGIYVCWGISRRISTDKLNREDVEKLSRYCKHHPYDIWTAENHAQVF